GVRSPVRAAVDALLPMLHGHLPQWGVLGRALVEPGPHRMLRRAGLVPRRRFVTLPRRATWARIVPAERLRAVLRESNRRSGIKRLSAEAILALVGGVVLAPESFVVCEPSGSAREDLRSLPERLAGRPGRPGPVTMALTDARVAVLGPEDFLKLPLSADQ